MLLLEKKLIFLPVLLIFLRIWGTLRYFLFIANVQDRSNGWKVFDDVLKLLQVQTDNMSEIKQDVLSNHSKPLLL